MSTTIIGVDCAGRYPKFGLALGTFSSEGTTILDVRTKEASVEEIILDWIPQEGPCVIALDAPLGWPLPLARGLESHIAGGRIVPRANYEDGARQLFRRETDRFVWATEGKKPLDVGADRIAWVAARALWLIDRLRRASDKELPLLWGTGVPVRPGIIEVYPAATLRAHFKTDESPKPDAGYKGNKDSHRDARQRLTGLLSDEMALELKQDSRKLMAESDDAFDAAICVLAAADFIQGEVYSPEDLDLAKKEGWIWLRRTL